MAVKNSCKANSGYKWARALFLDQMISILINGG